MHIGIIGGGLMGIALAYYLAQAGEQVTVLEQGTELGGLNGEIRFTNDLTVARYQHAIMPHDDNVRALCAELGLTRELVFREVFTGFVHDGRIFSMTGLRDFMTFPPLSLQGRLLLGNTVMRAIRDRNWQKLDALPVKDWLVQVGGQETFDRIWRPLLEAKFDGVYDRVPATYIWAWLNRMVAIRHIPTLRGTVGYLLGGHYSLIQALANAFVALGGRIETQVRVREIEVQAGQLQRVRTHSGTMNFDKLIAAIATPSLAHLIPGADLDYIRRLERSKYLGLICPVLVLDRPLSRYWTLNLTDPNSPFSTVIETPHAAQPDRHIVYLPRYTAPDNDWMGVSDHDIRAGWLEHLRHIFPDFREQSIRHFAVSRSRYVEPVYTVNTLGNLIDVTTPYASLYLANTTQVYPQLPTSEATIIHARQVADLVRRRQAQPINLAV